MQGIIELAHRLSITVCAEGVETPETFAFLEEAGCDAMQGVLLAKPVTAAEIDKIAGSWTPDKAAATLKSRMRAAPGAATSPKTHAVPTR